MMGRFQRTYRSDLIKWRFLNIGSSTTLLTLLLFMQQHKPQPPLCTKNRVLINILAISGHRGSPAVPELSTMTVSFWPSIHKKTLYLILDA